MYISCSGEPGNEASCGRFRVCSYVTCTRFDIEDMTKTFDQQTKEVNHI